MSKYVVIVPLTKSPHRGRGIHKRIGPRFLQDWVVGCRIARDLLLQHRGYSHILILSNVHVKGEEHEADLYAEELRRIGAQPFDVQKKGYERIAQIKVVKEEILDECDMDVVLIHTWLDYIRVRWLCKDLDSERVSHRIAFGIPRPWEAVTDIILLPGAILIDLLGKREAFLEWVRKRRAVDGKH